MTKSLGAERISLLKICAREKDLCQGCRVHADILRKGLLEKNPYLASTLIDMYAKCGVLAYAQRVHDELPVKSMVSWNALIAGYAQQKQGLEAINCFERMRNEGFPPDSVTFISALKACGSIGAINKGKQLHDEVNWGGFLQKNVMIGTSLVDMYAKCGELTNAEKLHKEFPVHDVVSWNALIAGYAQQGRCREALKCFEEMSNEGFYPDAITYACILKACGRTGDVEKGNQIHEQIISKGLLKKSIMINNALVDMYVKCGMLAKAHEILEGLPARSVFSWSSVIAGYAKQGLGCEALVCFDQMQSEGFSPDAVTFVHILKACASSRAVDKGIRIHDEIMSRGLLEKNVMLGTALVDMYVKCGLLLKAQEFLEQLVVRDVVSWSVLIAGYTLQGLFHEALGCFEQMQSEGFSPDAVTYVFIVKACGSIGAIGRGRMIHDEIMTKGFLKENLELGSALVDMYVKCGVLVQAQKVLEELHVRDEVSWNVLIAGYAQHGNAYEALSCFEQMKLEGLSPDTVTYISILKTCSSIGDIDKGERIYDEIACRGLMAHDMLVTTLVDMFAKCGLTAKAQALHEEFHVSNRASWNALISGYVQHGQAVEALDCFERMQSAGVTPDLVTFICILKACGSVGATVKGDEIHKEIVNSGFLEKNKVLGTALVDMYARCGLLLKARQVLEALPYEDIESWNALIAGYSRWGQCTEALSCFIRIQNHGLSPDTITFLCVLCACCHLGLLNEAEKHFTNMTRECCIPADIEHYSCMVAVYGSAGHFDKAVSMIESMPCFDHTAVWLALLGACRKWENLKLGKLAFHQVVILDSSCAAAYVLMANIFATAGMQRDTRKMEVMRTCVALKDEANPNDIWLFPNVETTHSHGCTENFLDRTISVVSVQCYI